MFRRIVAGNSGFRLTVPARYFQSSGDTDFLRRSVAKFDTSAAIEAACTPPSAWFNHLMFHELDKVASLGYVQQINLPL
jgi:hypothetical protein